MAAAIAPSAPQVKTRKRRRGRDDPATRALFERLRATGDPEALEALTTRYLPLARSLARRYYSGGEPLDDLMQVACMGLVKALQGYDARRGVSFPSYAVPTITGELKRYFRDAVWAAHVPRGLRERAFAVNRASREICEQTGRVPTAGQLADRLRLDEEDILRAQQAYGAFDAVSLDAPGSSEDQLDGRRRRRTDALGSLDDRYQLAEDRITISNAIGQLPANDTHLLHMRYIQGRTQADIAAHTGVSQMQVSRTLKRIIDHLHDLTHPDTASTADNRSIHQPPAFAGVATVPTDWVRRDEGRQVICQ